jgi:hypothetical protein
MSNKKNSVRSRTPLALTLIAASFLSACALTFFSQQGSDYWVAAVDMVPGHQIASGDIQLKHLDLNSSAALYLGSIDDPEGLVVLTRVEPGEILKSQGVSSMSNLKATSAVPVSIRAVDLAAGIHIGEALDIYWVVDNQNGELPIAPVLILGGVILLNFDQDSKNFGTDAALTVSVEATQVLRLLTATTHGRLVIVRSHV